jgi:putative transcriptional regulator
MAAKSKREAAQDRARLVFGGNLKRLRKNAGLSQEALGELADLDRTHIGYFENGRRIPQLDSIFMIAQALNVEAGDLLAALPPSPPGPSAS